MYRFYTPLLLLQAFCVYHAYRNNADQRWYWFIILFPGVGSAFYLFHHFYNRNNVNTITEAVKGVVNSNYKIDQLEKAFRFSDNLRNRMNLADAYVDHQRYADAIRNFPGCTHLQLLKDAGNDTTYTTLSHWNDPKDLENYRKSELFGKVWGRVKTLFAERSQAFSLEKFIEVE